nr:hypothetical protein [Tanacetum cinerariifolium]
MVQHSSKYSPPETGLVVLVFQKGDDPIDAINHMMSFLTAVVTSRPFTSGSGGAPGKQRVIVYYNCKGEGHMSKQCTKPKRKRDAEWFKDKVLLVQAQANGQVLQEGELEFLADPGTAESSSNQTAQQLKPKLYAGRIIEKSDDVVIPDTEETLMLAEESLKTDEPNLSATTTIVEVPKELPKVNMVNSCLKRLKSHIASFDMVVKERTITTAITEEFFEINELKAQAQAKDTVILQLKEKLHSLKGDVTKRSVKREVEEIETLNVELDHKEKVLVITALKEQLSKIKGKAVLNEAVSLNPINLELLKVDVAPLVPKLRKNRTANIDYIRHTLDEAAILGRL